MVALMIPAVEEFTLCSATANSRYGTALANSAATAMCAHSRAERGTCSLRASKMANSTAGASLRELMDHMGHSSTRAALLY
jgi:hypothetical protein